MIIEQIKNEEYEKVSQMPMGSVREALKSLQQELGNDLFATVEIMEKINMGNS